MDRRETTELLRRARGGSPEALEALLERSAGKLLALIRLRMGPRLRARLESRDILQACLLKAYRRLDQLESSGSAGLMAWLARIAENEIRDQAAYHQRQRRDAGRDVALDGVAPGLAAGLRSATSELALDERLRQVEAALEALDERHREVILLRKLEELSYAEIGRRLGKSPDACRMLLSRAMASLTLKLEGLS